MPGFGTLEERLVAALEARILDGAYAPGEHLRQEAVAAEFSVSHIPVREAFRTLSARGYLQTHARRGVTVTPISANDIVQLLETRTLLEVALLRSAIPHMTPSDLTLADAAVAEATAPSARLAWPELNWRFHRAIYTPAPNKLLLQLVEQLHLDVRSKRLHRIITHDIQHSTQEHRHLLQMIRKKNVDGACKLLKRHIGVSSTELKALLRRLEAS